MFPLVDVEVSSRGTSKLSTGKARQEYSCSAGSNDKECFTSSVKEARSDATMKKRDDNELESTAGSGSAFPLVAFLRVELVGLDGAEVTFRPGGSRRKALLQELADRRAAEQKACRVFRVCHLPSRRRCCVVFRRHQKVMFSMLNVMHYFLAVLFRSLSLVQLEQFREWDWLSIFSLSSTL